MKINVLPVVTGFYGASALMNPSGKPAIAAPQGKVNVTTLRLMTCIANSAREYLPVIRETANSNNNSNNALQESVTRTVSLEDPLFGAQITALDAQLFHALEDAGIDLQPVLEGLRLWTEAHRGYHSLDHLDQLVNDIVALDAQIIGDDDRNRLLLTAFFHDVIYQPGLPDNEDKSRDFYIDSLPKDIAPDQKVVDCIMATKGAFPPEQSEDKALERLFWTLDNQIVYSASFDDMLKWEAGVFKEFGSQCPLDFYIEKRVEFLESRLEKTPELFPAEQNNANLRDLITVVQSRKNEV